MPDGTTTPRFGDPRLPKRFWEKVRIDPDGCWRWTAAKTRNGYSKVGWQGKTPTAHGLLYRLLVSEVDGVQIDHTCHDPEFCKDGNECPHRLCVNPAHLRLVSHAENMDVSRARRVKSEQTHCKHGHAFSEKNTYVNPKNGHRVCRTCYRGSYSKRAEHKRQRRAEDSRYGR